MNINDQLSGLSDDEWLKVLQKSVTKPYMSGVEFPRFPHSSVQLGYNGAADEEGILRAHSFWMYADGYSKALGQPINSSSKVLDIGCGWGRITRVFSRDVPANNLYGVDIDPEAVALCRSLGVEGSFVVTQPNEALPFPDSTFNVITASSVFTHLPEKVAGNLAQDIARVAAPGSLFVFTVEDDSFIENIATPGIENSGERWRLLSRYKEDLESLRERYLSGEYIYLTTNDETVRSSDVYGDAVVPPKWIEDNWGHLFDLVVYEKAKPHVYQAVVVLRRK